MQIEAYGDLKPSTGRRLRNIVDAVRTGNQDGIGSAPRLKPGTKLIRIWQDKTQIVTALEDGSEWQGRGTLLSYVARAIIERDGRAGVFAARSLRPAGNNRRCLSG